ncbi:uncharacterized protein C1orf87 homolog [Perognathus longimembris pacificus]|uniref:uncharacterized protein C1orf87 homolog n=1 Tax=Perognathus longimembris pacificus TaxID=214514 RepID=UPI002019BE91|nr:uncharacterized protein C1orf87 homolog [Perognathus longimembris pacificus]
MSSGWKTPHESDAMPEIMVKIIGSKHFRYIVEKPMTKQEEILKAETQLALQKSKPMSGNAKQMSKNAESHTGCSDQQTRDNPDDVEEKKHPNSNQKLLMGTHANRLLGNKSSRQTNAHCYSVPTGDQALSYIHGLPRRKLKDSSLEHMEKNSSCQLKDIGQKPNGTQREDAFLLALIRRELMSQPLSSSLLHNLHKELKTLDPISSQFLLKSQLSQLLIRHQVPLQLPTVKLLFQRFSKRGSPEMVNYEKLLWFLKDATSDEFQQNTTVVDSTLKKTQSHSNHSQRAPPQGSSLQSEINKSLLEILKMALKIANGRPNITNLNLSFRKEDHSFSGCLPLPKVRAICGKHGLYITLSLLETLLNYQDLGYQGEIRWQKFVDLLSQASLDLSDTSTGKFAKDSPTTQRKSEVHEIAQSKTEHVNTAEEKQQPESPLAKTSAPQDALSSLKIRPASQPPMSPAMKNKPEECEMWIDRFRKLENALYLCNPSNTGVLEKGRARRLIHNYNLMYNLSLSPRKIDQALQRFCKGENMVLEPALRYLKEL